MQGTLITRLLSHAQEPVATKQRRMVTKGGIVQRPRALDEDLRQYNDALEGLREAMAYVEL